MLKFFARLFGGIDRTEAATDRAAAAAERIAVAFEKAADALEARLGLHELPALLPAPQAPAAEEDAGGEPGRNGRRHKVSAR